MEFDKVKNMAEESTAVIDREVPVNEPEYIDARELVNRIADAGQSRVIKVRAIDLKTGRTSVGYAKPDWERLGPVFVTWKDPRNRDWATTILPLGGHVRFHHFSTKTLGSNARVANLESLQTPQSPPTNVPITPEALDRKFEILDPDDGWTPEELVAIAKVDAELAKDK